MNLYRIEYEIFPLPAIYITEQRAEIEQDAKDIVNSVQNARIRKCELVRGNNAKIESDKGG